LEQAQNNLTDFNDTDGHVVQLNAQYIKDLSFECPDALKVLQQADIETSFNVGLEINSQQIGEDIFEVGLSIQIKATKEAQAVYICELEYAGIITLKNVPDDQKQAYLMVKGPSYIFPFARQVIANITTESGFQPFLMQPIDFDVLYKQREIDESQRN